jgi:hypothetical protein
MKYPSGKTIKRGDVAMVIVPVYTGYEGDALTLYDVPRFDIGDIVRVERIDPHASTLNVAVADENYPSARLHDAGWWVNNGRIELLSRS